MSRRIGGTASSVVSSLSCHPVLPLLTNTEGRKRGSNIGGHPRWSLELRGASGDGPRGWRASHVSGRPEDEQRGVRQAVQGGQGPAGREGDEEPVKETRSSRREAGRNSRDCGVTGPVGIFKVRRVVPGVVSKAAEMRSKDASRRAAMGFGH